MLRGCQKKVIHVRSPGSDLFEEVYFIVRENSQTPAAPGDMVREAEKWLSGVREPSASGRTFLKLLAAFLTGAVSVIVFLTVYYLIRLL